MAVQFDAIIIGGGLTGNIMAVSLAHAGLSVAVLDRDEKPGLVKTGYDGRSSALAFGAQQVLEALEIWSLVADAAQPIQDIRITDAGQHFKPSPFFLHYDHLELNHPVSRQKNHAHQAAPFGWIIENREIRLALQQALQTYANVTQYHGIEVKQLTREAHRATVTLASGDILQAQLIIGADGRRSQIRDMVGLKSWHHAYDQSAIVCSVAHPYDHQGVAHEHFLPAGPFAVLPMRPGSDGGYRSSIVWTEKTSHVPSLMALSDDRFSAEMTRRFGKSLGPLTLIGGRWQYPLSVMHAAQYFDQRVVLIGDAAHGIHPISGQGLNLGIKDVAALAELVVDHMRKGGDIGDLHILQTYEQWRRPDNLTLIAVTDGLNRLFSNNYKAVRYVRDIGMVALGSVPPLKRLFMRHAMGIAGNTPRLIRGEKL